MSQSIEVEDKPKFSKYFEPSLFNSVGITYKMMFREEWRQNIDFAKKRHVLLFPALLSCLLYTSPSPRDRTRSRMPSSA